MLPAVGDDHRHPRRSSQLGRFHLGCHTTGADLAGGIRRQALDFGVYRPDLGDEPSVGVAVGVGGIKPAGVSENQKQIGVDEVSHHRREVIVIAEDGFTNLVNSDHVVFVDDAEHL